jgi:hypothetical protein
MTQAGICIPRLSKSRDSNSGLLREDKHQSSLYYTFRGNGVVVKKIKD